MNEKYCLTRAFINDSAISSFSVEEATAFANFLAGFNAGVVDGKTGYIAVYGALGIGYWDASFTNYSDLKANIAGMIKNKKIENIVLCINSPGGSAAGLFDCCKYIQSACKKKPITAYVNGMACSAAYAIASACDKIIASEGSEVGCCGCYAHVLEFSDDFYKEEGLLSRVFRSKNAPRKNLSVITNEEEAKAYQQDIDMLGDQYLEMVAGMRGVSLESAEKDFGQGAVICDLNLALKNGMIDEIGSIEFIENLYCSPNKEGEGEDMADIKSMSAEDLLKEMSDEQKTELSAKLCTSNPSLTDEEKNEVRKAERERIASLNAMRNGSEAINAIVDSAVEDGRSADQIALECFNAIKNQPTSNDSVDAGKATLEMLERETEDVNVPSAAMTEEQIIDLLTKN